MSNIKTFAPNALAGVFKALANPHRIAVFMRLAACCGPGTTCEGVSMKTYVGDIGKDLDIAPSTVSHHLKELRNAGLVHMERAGQNVECWVEPDTLDALSRFFRDAGGTDQN